MNADTPFHPRAVLAMLAIGTLAFLVFLYALGQGWTGTDERDGGAHAAGNGLNGFSALAQLLERRGGQVTLSRNAARLDEPGLVVITPQPFGDGGEVRAAIIARRYIGPTLVIAPKWLAAPVPVAAGIDAPQGWVTLADADAPDWIGALPGFSGTTARIVARARWQGMGLSGALPAGRTTLTMSGGDFATLVRDDQGTALAALAPMGEAQWPIVVVAEPDLLNNYGLADQRRARLALALVDEALQGADLPVTFDLTLAGLGAGENLLTLAFRPPFLAATLCLLLAALLVAWRAFRRFGPPAAEAPAMALGKRQLARNGAGLIERSGRLHLLGPPYAALLAGRIARRLGIREPLVPERDRAAARILDSRGVAGDYTARLEALRSARRAGDLLRAAGALKTIERTLTE